MKKNKIIFWITTVIISLMMILSAINYFTNAEVIIEMSRLGFPSFFVKELGMFKIIGALVLIIPLIPTKIKEWAYAGFGIVFISAFIAHLNAGDPVSTAAAPLVFLAILAVSNVFYHKTKNHE
ncbi:DoxX family protein [Putridiphycobacter roseus]|uniref:DoxX family protein n=1 Tax=Putridiphycobacter roseus TaxID=2219161 RepID=A0A2W1N9X8_9FLAO|nr:DoxX family protein [Putridiphycobacter roseus]PZE15833.1 DoxX family protein [Putridiphycobacter roseus]